MNNMMQFLKGLIKKSQPDLFNVHHPRFAGQIEPAFKIKSTQYYRFKQDTKLPYGRYQVLQAFLLSYDLKMDSTLFKLYIEQIEASLNGSKGQINLGKTFELIEKMKARAALAFDPSHAYSIASVVYFDESEDLFKYDTAHNHDKIQSWKEAKQLDFFYTRPISELLGLNNFSEKDLIDYIKEAEELLSDLTLDTQPA